MNADLNKIALTHRSALNENKNLISNERLEFLGDAVLELIVSEYLYQHFPKDEEGKLSQNRSQIVQTRSLALASKRLGLDRQLILSKGEAKSGGRRNESILADCFEAVIGAIYLTKGFNSAVKFIEANLLRFKPEIIDYKSLLQEIWQKQHHLAPKYKLLKTTGPDHQKTFTVGVYLNRVLIVTGSGASKQKAEMAAAQAAVAKFK